MDSFKTASVAGQQVARGLSRISRASVKASRNIFGGRHKATSLQDLLSYYPLGFGSANEDITYSKAGAAAAYCYVPEVNNAISSIVGGIESLPWDIVRYPEGRRRQNRRRIEGDVIASDNDLQINHPFQRAVKRFHHRNNFGLISTIALDYTLYGEVFLEIARNQYWADELIEWLNPLGVQISTYRGIEHFRYGWNTTFVTYSPDEIAYLHNRNPQNDFEGYPPVLAVLNKVNISRNLDRFLRDYFINNARPTVVVAPPTPELDFSNADFERIKTLFSEQMKGAGGQYGTFVAQRAVSVTPLDQPDLGKNSELTENQINAIYEKFSVPRAMRGNTSATPYKDGDETTRRFYLDAVIPLAKTLQQFINVEIMPYFDLSGGSEVFEFDTSAYDMVTAADQIEGQVVHSQVQSGYLSLGEAARIQERPTPEWLNERYMVRGLPMTPQQIDKLVQAEIERSVGSGSLIDIDGNELGRLNMPRTPGGQPSEPRQRLGENNTNESGFDKAGLPEACILLKLANNPDLLALRKRVEEYIGDAEVEWNIPDSYHVTLAYIPGVHEDQLETLKAGLKRIELPDMKLNIGSMDSFQDFDRFTIHFKIRRNIKLLDLHQKIIDLCDELDVERSIYSDPDNYVPHITLGYTNERPGRMTYHSKIMVHATSLQLTDENHDVLLEIEPDSSEPHKHHAADWQLKLYADDPDEDEIRKRIAGELKAYRAYELKRFGSKTRDFAPDVLPPFIHHALIDALDNAKSRDDIDTIFGEVLEYPRVKSLSSYQSSLREFGRGLWNGVLDAERVTDGIQNLIEREFQTAFYQGIERGGLDPEDLTEDDVTELATLIETERGHVPGLVAWIEENNRARGGRLTAVRRRVDQWVSQFANVVEVGYLVAKRDGKIKWKRDPRKESCQSCLALDGQVRRASFWRALGIAPRDKKLACFGIWCGCEFEDTDDPISKGRLPALGLRE